MYPSSLRCESTAPRYADASTIEVMVAGIGQAVDMGEVGRPGIDDAHQGPYLHALGVLVQSKMLVTGESS